jgi:diadenylate cyclase
MELFRYEFLDFTLLDLLDVAVVSYIVYRVLMLIRGTRSAQIVIGLTILLLVAFISFWFQLEGLKWLFANLATIGFIVLVIIFQPEIRGALAQIGHSRFFKHLFKYEAHKAVDELVKGVIRLSELRYGALIVIQRAVGLRNIIETGRDVNAQLSSDLLTTIFTPYTPLHDGAVVVKGDDVIAAACVLPMTQNPRFDQLFGMRHRAAVGITEESDAVCLVVSEETGAISCTYKGILKRDLEKLNLKETLLGILEK